MGFVRRQVAAVVAWQATSFCVVALAVGMPLGVAGGRWAWSLVSSGIGSASPAVVPATIIALMLPATLAVGNLIAVLPGWAAARVAPAVVMRNE
jgi:ABC-type antimicrobial peptide transport system permease subunit